MSPSRKRSARPSVRAGGGLRGTAMGPSGGGGWCRGGAARSRPGVIGLIAGPVLLDPIFTRFTPLADDAPERAAIVELAREAGVRVDKVLVVDASRRTTASNAYVTGLGPSKRVVVFDNLLADFEPDEVRFVIAHELAHVRYRDVQHGLLFAALLAPFATYAVAVLAEELGAEPDHRAIAPVALAAALVAAPLGPISNQ